MKKFTPFQSILTLCLLSSLSNAQNSPMSASAGLGPGNSFTLFIEFQKSMPKVQNINCACNLQGAAKPGQEDFTKEFRCSGPPIKDDDTHYREKVDIPQEIAAGDYKISWINVSVDNVGHQYEGTGLPTLAPVTVSNPKHLEFSPIEKLEIKKGSGRESVETFDLRGFSSCVQFNSSSRRRCGNVETRVFWGFPSSEGGQNRCGRRRSIIPPSERHFHSEAPVYRSFWRECVVWAAGGAKIGASQKAA
jgi:hypothetical protein